MSRELLIVKTAKELRDMAKERNITGRWDMNKVELVDAILNAENVKESNQSVETESANVKDKIEGTKTNVKNEYVKSELSEVKKQKSIFKVEHKEENKMCSIPKDFDALTEERKRYVIDADMGAIVAFSDGKRVRSAAITNRNRKKNLLKVQTKAGQEFVVEYKDIIWVRTGKRWPRWVFNLLTGGTDAYEQAVKNS